MSPKDPFLPQVRATPDDTALRLVYADWLEEQGDPRGELIRLETRLSSLAPSGDEYVQLKPRRDELRSQVDKKWLRAMGYVPRHRPLFGRLPRRRVERWRLVEEFIEVWYRPLQAGDRFSEEELAAAEARLGLRLPAALREWYALAGKRKDVWSKQDWLQAPHELKVDEQHDALIFRYENQNCETWGIRARDLERDDPPVFELYNPGRSSPTTTAFAILVLLYEAKFAPGVVAAGGPVLEGVVREEVERKWSKCRLPDRYWAASPVSFYEGNDLLVETADEEWVYVTARTEDAFGQLSEDLRRRLERYT
jgi:uncharacterized protein (TIGR02996 family)